MSTEKVYIKEEMDYDFDIVHERRGTSSLKHDSVPVGKGGDDVIPLWIADMDFALPQEIVDDIRAVVDGGIFGYGFDDGRCSEAICSWYLSRHDWACEPEWIVRTPGVMFAIGIALQAFSSPGDAVLIQRPVYHPFSQIIRRSGRRLIDNGLVYEDGRYQVDFADFERCIEENDVKIFVLCNPHNPVGRVWSEVELDHMGSICLEHGVLVIADEIHGDFTYQGFEHHVFAGVNESFLDHCIICTSPSKTFNLAGLQTANIFIPDSGLRKRFRSVMQGIGYSDTTLVARTAACSAYTKGGEWHRQMKKYLQGNLDFSRSFIEKHVPQISLVEPEGTYLLWLDCTALGLDDQGLDDFIIDEAHLWLDAGGKFGPRSGQFQRMNIACPRSTLARAWIQLCGAVEGLG